MPDIGTLRHLMKERILTVADLDLPTTGSSLGEYAVAEIEKFTTRISWNRTDFQYNRETGAKHSNLTTVRINRSDTFYSKFCLINARSVLNKTDEINELSTSRKMCNS